MSRASPFRDDATAVGKSVPEQLGQVSCVFEFASYHTAEHVQHCPSSFDRVKLTFMLCRKEKPDPSRRGESSPLTTSGYSMPWHWPEYAPPPYHLSAVHGANFLGRVPAEVARALVPEPLQLGAQPRVWVYLVEITIDAPISIRYHELGILVPVTLNGAPGLFPLVLFLDHSLPVTVGREIWGFPKKIADTIALRRRDDVVQGTVTHQGVPIVDFSFRTGQGQAAAMPGRTHTIFTQRHFPSESPSRPPVSQLMELDWITINESKQLATDSSLRINFPDSTPLQALNHCSFPEVWYSSSDGGELTCGRILHDLKNKPRHT